MCNKQLSDVKHSCRLNLTAAQVHVIYAGIDQATLRHAHTSVRKHLLWSFCNLLSLFYHVGGCLWHLFCRVALTLSFCSDKSAPRCCCAFVPNVEGKCCHQHKRAGKQCKTGSGRTSCSFPQVRWVSPQSTTEKATQLLTT